MKSIQINLENGDVELIGMDAIELAMLERLSGVSRDKGSDRFLQPDPMDPGDDSPEARDLRDDWMNLVVPELLDHFDAQISKVAADLDARVPGECGDEFLVGFGDHGELPELGGHCNVRIPREHVEDWYGALNQARLALDARYDLSGEIEPVGALETQSPAWRQAWFHSRFYGMLQMPLMEVMQRFSGLPDDGESRSPFD